jgi:ankyrin repeat protein
MAEFLIDKGADINIIDTYGHTPLKIANLSKRTEIAAMLSEHGARE